MRHSFRFLLGLACAFMLSLGSLDHADTALHNVRGFLPDLRFTLESAGGKTVTQDNFKGKTVLMFFGYASCPDVCPTTMAPLSQVMLELGDQADKVRICLSAWIRTAIRLRSCKLM